MPDETTTTEIPRDPVREKVRVLVRTHYDAQKLRIEMNNRICAHLRDGVLDDAGAAQLRAHGDELAAVEKSILRDVKKALKQADIQPWLNGVKGVGPAMAGVIVSEIGDPTKFATCSKLWAYCGLHVIDGRAARRVKGQRANWNNFLKTKLIGVLGPSFLKAKSPYREHYDNMRTRLESRPCNLPPEKHKTGATKDDLLPNGCSNGHMHNKAIRYMVKMFLLDLYKEWCALRGFDIRPPYKDEYLGKTHGSGPQEIAS